MSYTDFYIFGFERARAIFPAATVTTAAAPARVVGSGGNNHDSSGVNSTLSATGAVVASGNAVAGVVSHTSGNSLTSVTDDKGNTYNLETSILDSVNGQRASAFSLGNITNGPKTVTMTLSGNDGAMSIMWDAYSGVNAATDPRDATAHGGQVQAAPGTGTNAVLSGAFTTVTNGDLVVGLYAGTHGQGGTITAGTTTLTYTNGNNDNNAPLCAELQSEWAVQTTAGSGTQTSFTQSVAGATICFLIALKPT